MTVVNFELEGVQEVRDALDDLEDRWAEDSVQLVGTNVKYSVFLEFGTSKMDPKPFFRPAIHQIRTQGVRTFIDQHGDRPFEAINSTRQLIDQTATALKNRIQGIIKKKGLILTGKLHASITAIPVGGGEGTSKEFEMSA